MKGSSLCRKLRRQDWDSLAPELCYHAYALCNRWHVNRKALIRAFREVFDISPRRFFEQLRDRRALALVKAGKRKKEIVDELGYKHAAHLSRRLRQAELKQKPLPAESPNVPKSCPAKLNFSRPDDGEPRAPSPPN